MSITWFHSYRFPDGEAVDGWKPYDRLKWESDLVFKHDITGKSVLDIGSWDGYFSFDAERRGAASVLATDHYAWGGAGYGNKNGFDYAHGKFGSKVKSEEVDVFSLDPAKLGTFDVVLFLGVLYHLTDPFGGLAKAGAMTHDRLVVETVTAMHDIQEPVMRYFLHDELGKDATNFWAPNPLCLENMLREIGFTRFDIDVYAQDPKYPRTIVHAWR